MRFLGTEFRFAFLFSYRFSYWGSGPAELRRAEGVSIKT